jgi:hypothetical protein
VRIDVAHLGEPVEELRARPVVDPAGAVALHVAVAADRAGPGSLAPDVAPQQQHVDDLPDRVHAVLMPVPSAACRARPLASWHMFEQSGRLLVPNSRTHSWYRNVASLLSRPEV